MGIAHFRCRVGGSISGRAEAWSVGMNFLSGDGDAGAGLAGVQAKLESWRDGVRAYNGNNIIPPSWKDAIGAAAKVDFVRCSLIGTDGKEQAVALTQLANGVQGGNIARHTPQTSVTISLQTGRPGASYRGRLYLPAMSVPIGPDMKIADLLLQTLANESAAYLKAVSQAGASVFSPGLTAVVISTARSVGTPITSVRVGDRLDVQRRRADGQDEAYANALVTQ